MTVTEAGACGTPSVATRIGGHQDAVVDGQSGLLVDGTDDMVRALGAVLSDDVLRRRLGVGALDRAAKLTWDATARGTLAALGAEALARPV
jgi:glycosyltransferase involved in cell wall biosynthesis